MEIKLQGDSSAAYPLAAFLQLSGLGCLCLYQFKIFPFAHYAAFLKAAYGRSASQMELRFFFQSAALSSLRKDCGLEAMTESCVIVRTAS